MYIKIAKFEEKAKRYTYIMRIDLTFFHSKLVIALFSLVNVGEKEKEEADER